jgi:hypothetical protein
MFPHRMLGRHHFSMWKRMAGRCRVSSFACFFSFAKHETKQNSSSVSRNFACFAKQNISRNFVLFRFVNSKISFRFAKFHLDLLRFATFYLVSYCFAKFHLVSFRFADIQTVSFHKVNISIRFLTVLRIRIHKNPKLFNTSTVDPNPKKFLKEGMEKMYAYYVISVAEPEPHGAASFGQSRSHNAMQLRLRRHRVLEWY